ncbi:acyl carrier protein [Streptomyces ipomoeae]|nr:acyl carrier protein [Streptomyces ipomoeae]MDX2698279.1 acyl carrier protein [Streptomyces ipomoeae]
MNEVAFVCFMPANSPWNGLDIGDIDAEPVGNAPRGGDSDRTEARGVKGLPRVHGCRSPLTCSFGSAGAGPPEPAHYVEPGLQCGRRHSGGAFRVSDARLCAVAPAISLFVAITRMKWLFSGHALSAMITLCCASYPRHAWRLAGVLIGMDRIPEHLVALVAGQLGVGPDQFSATTTLQDLGIDSLGLMELVVAAEERFGIVLPEDVLDLAPNATLGEAARLFPVTESDPSSPAARIAPGAEL